MIIFPWLEQRKTEGLDRLTHQLSVKMASGHNLTCGAGHSGNIHCSPRMSLQPAELLTLSQSIVSKGLSNKECPIWLAQRNTTHRGVPLSLICCRSNLTETQTHRNDGDPH